jgi:hypothetical protein
MNMNLDVSHDTQYRLQITIIRTHRIFEWFKTSWFQLKHLTILNFFWIWIQIALPLFSFGVISKIGCNFDVHTSLIVQGLKKRSRCSLFQPHLWLRGF